MKQPAFLFYPEAFLVGTMDMTDKEVGQYIRLLCRQHQKGHIAPEKIEFFSEEVRSKFVQDENGFYFNKRLEEEIQKRTKFVESKRVNGSKGGRPKKAIAESNENQNKTDRFQVGLATENLPINRNININLLANEQELFKHLWSLYPNKKGKARVSEKSKKELAKIGKEEMERAIKRYIDELEKDKDWRKPQNGSTFFNSGYVDYLDENYVPSIKTGKRTLLEKMREEGRL